MEITEQTNACFTEAAMSGGMLRKVCIFGNKKSKNNRLYSDTAINNLVEQSNGLKAYLNHPTKRETQDRDGVRDVRDWLGVFSSPYRAGDKVIANLTVRAEHKGLIGDILKLSPANVGMSINARVKVHQGADNMEVVESVNLLRSADLVMSAATTQSLLESHYESEEDEKTLEESAKEFLGGKPELSKDQKEARFDFTENLR